MSKQPWEKLQQAAERHYWHLPADDAERGLRAQLRRFKTLCEMTVWRQERDDDSCPECYTKAGKGYLLVYNKA